MLYDLFTGLFAQTYFGWLGLLVFLLYCVLGLSPFQVPQRHISVIL